MKILSKIALAALLTVSGSLIVLASVEDLPTVNRDGQLYHYYEVQPKETIYSLTHKLGITKDEIIAANPSVAEGLKAHSVLYFPANKAVPRTHTAVKGETIYGISHRYGMTVDDLIARNPMLKDGLKPGMILMLDNVSSSSATVAGDINRTHLVNQGETFYSIARRYGVTVADLEKVNPGVSVLQAGSTINVPVPTVTNVAVNPADNTVVETVSTPTSTTIETEPTPVDVRPSDTPVVTTPAVSETNPVAITTPERREVKMAVLLPFMLNGGKTEKNARRSTEFYQGFLLAVDSLRHSNNRLSIMTFDTHNNIDSVKKILSRPELKNVNIMIVPDNADQLKVISDFAADNSTFMFNPFAVRDTSYVTNPLMMQANIPSPIMLEKAANSLIDNLGNSTPVIVSRKTGNTDRNDFIKLLTAKLSSRGIKYQTIDYTGKLAATNLSTLSPNHEWLFIPVSGRGAEFNRLFPAISDFHNKCISAGGDVRVFGYPDWIVFRGEAATNLKKLDTTIYSRFYTDPESWDLKNLDEIFVKWYGHPMDKTVPRQALLGFDSGMFLLNWINTTGGDLSSAIPDYNGVQNSFKFITPQGNKGLVNDVIYMINIRPSGLSDARLY